MKFYIVDAFASEIFGGNPAGVVILDWEQEFPDEEIMIKTAKELRYSETVFVKELEDGSFEMRYFTPAAEVDLCGHATIGGFHCLQKHLGLDYNQSHLVRTKADDILVDLLENEVLMDMARPKDIGKIDDPEALKELYEVMGLDYKELDLKPRMISTGLPDIMMPVENEEDLEKISPDFERLTDLSRKYEVVGVHAFCLDSKDGHIHARNFAPLYDIDEEAATGTSNGALSYYLYTEGKIEADKVYTIIQGEKMGRPSSISVKIGENENGYRVQVGGSSVILAEGIIYL